VDILFIFYTDEDTQAWRCIFIVEDKKEYTINFFISNSHKKKILFLL